MEQHEMDDLLTKVLQGTASPEEITLVQQWYSQVHGSTIELPFESVEDHEQTRERLLAGIRESMRSTAVVAPIRTKKYRLLKVAAAAAVIVIAGSVAFYTSDRQSGQTQAVTAKVASDAAPGTDKAILTLADGSKVELDSRPEGVINEDMNVRIMKLANGQIVYEPLSENKENSAVGVNVMATPRGGQYQLTLPDGTRIWLNALSSITYPVIFQENDRTITITGEVYLEVSKDARRPFYVKVKDVTVAVLGTSFNVNAYEETTGVQTSLVTGVVKVTEGGDVVTLVPGQRAETTSNGIAVNSNIDLEKILAWKNGFFDFDNADIHTIMSQVSRWYDLNVIYEGKKPQQRYGGRISRDLYASQMLKVLEASGLRFRIEGKDLIIME